MRAVVGLGIVFIVAGCGSGGGGDDAEGSAAKQPVELVAADKVKVFGDWYRTPKRGRIVALLFHQAGSNAGEYAQIAPKLVDRGIECLAIDQRAGGEMWGQPNRTMKESGRTDWKYEDAYADLEAAYEWAKRRDYGKILIWGSSYSASLALKLAAEQDVTAVVAFSPGEYFSDKKTVSTWNANVKKPCFFGFTKQEAMDGGFILHQSAPESVERKFDKIIVNKDGVHGSSTLLKDKAPNAYGYYWKELFDFLEQQKIAQPRKDGDE